MSDYVNKTFKSGKLEMFPTNEHVKNWVFQENEEDEAHLCEFMARVGAKNGLNQNDFMKLFPGVLRMLKSNSEWAK